MPDAYIGKNIFLRDTIEGFIEGSNNCTFFNRVS